MPKRLRLGREHRGRYVVLVDGVSLGHVSDSHGDWWALPARPVVCATYTVAAFPSTPNRYGLWADADRIAPLASRRDAVAVLCDIQGLPESIALDLWTGQPMSAAQDAWVARALRGFADADEYEAYATAWRRRHLPGGDEGPTSTQ